MAECTEGLRGPTNQILELTGAERLGPSEVGQPIKGGRLGLVRRAARRSQRGITCPQGRTNDSASRPPATLTTPAPAPSATALASWDDASSSIAPPTVPSPAVPPKAQ